MRRVASSKFAGILIVLSMVVPTLVSTNARSADTTKEFVNSCVYGTLAGTLVGLASLAFTSQPGDNLQNIARGASFGLYAGILLGFYTVYSDSPSTAPTGEQAPAHSNLKLPLEKLDHKAPRVFPSLLPVVSAEHGVEGAGMGLAFLF